MGRLPVEKKKKTAWPWVAGVVVLALVIWGTTTLLTEEPEPEAPDIGVTASDTLPPSPIPTDTDPPAGTPDTSPSPASDTAAALDEDQVGETVRTEGEVVATGNEAFWILVDSRILRVDSPRRARKGDTVSVRGTLMDADAQKTDRMASEVISRHPDFESWIVLRSLKLVEEGTTETAAR